MSTKVFGIQVLDRQTAVDEGYQALTIAYTKQEFWMLRRVIDDLQDIDFCLVQPNLAVEEFEVFRKGMIF